MFSDGLHVGGSHSVVLALVDLVPLNVWSAVCRVPWYSDSVHQVDVKHHALAQSSFCLAEHLFQR